MLIPLAGARAVTSQWSVVLSQDRNEWRGADRGASDDRGADDEAGTVCWSRTMSVLGGPDLNRPEPKG